MDLGKHLRKLSQQINQAKDNLDDKILNVLDAVGKQAVSIALSSKTYKDQTGNLSASIGYGVFHYGNNYSIGGFGGGEGEQKGTEKLYNVASEYANRPYILVVVAGMDYALYVERCGFVVLDAAEMRTEGILRNELSKIRIFI